MKRSTPDSKPKDDAFALLMGSNAKKKKSQNKGTSSATMRSRFVECPAGCGRHFLEKDINDHLDICVVDSPSELSLPNTKLATESLVPLSLDGANPPSSRVKASSSKGNVDSGNNAFSHMMKQSAKVFSISDETRWAQRFHLNENGALSIVCYSTNPGLWQPDDIKWFTQVQVKATQRKANEPATGMMHDDIASPKGVDLALSSTIPSATSKIRMVHRHSRLSVPVLKSILQKAIRRRKPLPAVRVAMELADKSLGDLLRRLPIIILEDSTLHPSFPLLVWLMAAHAKDFEPNKFLLSKIFCAVYEIASCPWQDHLKNLATGAIESKQLDRTADVTFDSYHKPGIDHLLEDHDVYLWSMLLRVRYGGMRGDMEMLSSYINLWSSRFKNDTSLPKTVLKRMSSEKDDTTLRWSTVPTMIHQNAARQSSTKISSMIDKRVCALVLGDITTEGVDFHCSSVLDDVLSDPWLFQQCITQIGAVTSIVGLGPVPNGPSEIRSWIERILKRCMWNYSAGVNRRLPLVDEGSPGNELKDDPLKTIWQGLLFPRTKLFAENYVRNRLA